MQAAMKDGWGDWQVTPGSKFQQMNMYVEIDSTAVYGIVSHKVLREF